MKGFSSKSEGHYRRAVEIDHGVADARYYLGTALSGGPDLCDAERQFRRAIELRPDYYEAHLALGQLLKERDDLQGARAHFDAAARSPDPQFRSAASRLR